MNKTTQKLDEILEKMIEEIGDGGMDTSYQGRNYNMAKSNAKIAIIDLIAEINNNYKNQPIDIRHCKLCGNDFDIDKGHICKSI